MACSSTHKYLPKCNHKQCWGCYFAANKAKTFGHKMVLAKYGKEVFTRINGSKFVKYFETFIGEQHGN